MIKSSQHILKFANKSKLNQLENLYSDYKTDLDFYIFLIVSEQLPLKNNLSSKILPNKIIAHSRWKQVLYKHASEIVRSNIKFQQNKRYTRYKRCYSYFKKNNRQLKFLSKRFSELNLKSIIKCIKIIVKNLSLTIDERFISFKNESLHFNEFLGLKLPYFNEKGTRALQINLPIKFHKQSLKYKYWERKKTVQLSKINDNFYVKFIYEKENTPLNTSNNNLGIDIGYKKLISDSNGKHYGKELEIIYKKLASKERKSKNYNQYLVFKKNKINEICNSFIKENTNLSLLAIEDLNNVKHKSKFSRKFNNKLQYWSYKQVTENLYQKSLERGYYLLKVLPNYTSQECSKCGTANKDNRKGELYSCSCGNLTDADTNAAINILRRGIYSFSGNQANCNKNT